MHATASMTLGTNVTIDTNKSTFNAGKNTIGKELDDKFFRKHIKLVNIFVI